MPSIRNALDRLAARLAGRSYVTLRFTVHARLAPIVEPLIERLLPFDDDGETYRCSIAQWTLNERPVLHVHRGEVSTFRVDGPLQTMDGLYFPLGGLIESPGVTAHLNPIEARRLDCFLNGVIEQTIRGWIIAHCLDDQPRQRREIDRSKADREARKIIAEYVAEVAAEVHAAQAQPDSRKGSDHA